MKPYYICLWLTSFSMTISRSIHVLANGITVFCSFYGWVTFHWRRRWQPTLVLLSGKSHGWRSLVGCSPWGCKELDTTEQLHFHFSLSFIGEGNGNPLQCSCLENPRDGGAWWAAVCGVAQSWTWLKWLSSSSRTFHYIYVSCLLYPFLCWWTFRLLPCSGYCK